MAFELRDWNRNVIKQGDYRCLFNVARSDEVNSSPRYYGFMNDEGAYIIQAITTSSGIKIYKYYVQPPEKKANFDTDWSNRASLTYVEYYNLV